MSVRCYIGIDGGGTHTRSLLADERGRILGVGRAGSTNRNHHSRETVLRNMREAIASVLSQAPANAQLTVVFLGMCGVSTDADRADITAIVRDVPEVSSNTRIFVENDTRIGLSGGLSGRPGIVLIAGTGSACLGVGADGRTWLTGGWGALADDAGSAPWIGLRAIQTAARAEDGRLGSTALREIVFRFLKLSEPRQLLDRLHNQGLERAEMGLLAPLVIEAYRSGDAIAGAILQQAVGELSQMVAVVARKLFGEEQCELILVGGLALSGPPFQTMLIDRIQRDTPGVSVCEPELSPVQGAVLEALRADAVIWSKDILANIRAARM